MASLYFDLKAAQISPAFLEMASSERILRRNTMNSSPPTRPTISDVRDRAPDFTGNMPEHLIAEHMAERVIDGLEIVHINEQERRPVLLVILKRLGNLLLYALAGWTARSTDRYSPVPANGLLRSSVR